MLGWKKKKKTNKLVVMFPGTWEPDILYLNTNFQTDHLAFPIADHLRVLSWFGDIFPELSVYCDQNFILLFGGIEFYLNEILVCSFNKWNRYKWSCSGQIGIRNPSPVWPFTGSSPSLWRPQISLQVYRI